MDDLRSGAPPIARRPSPSLGRSRVAVTAMFALAGFVYAGWAVRIPDVKAQTGASEGALGTALLVMSLSAVVMMSVTGKLCRRFGSPMVTVVVGFVLPVTVVLPVMSRSPLSLAALLVLFGAAYGAVDVAVNSVAVDLIEMVGRPIMPTLHAANSIGSLLGALVGGVLAGFWSPLSSTVWVFLPVGLIVCLACAPTVLRTRRAPAEPIPAGTAALPLDVEPAAVGPAEERTSTGRPAWLGAGSVLVTGFALVALCSAFSQGAMDNWGPLHLRTDLGASAGLAAAGYAVFQGVLAVGRLAGGRLFERIGQSRVVVLGSVAAGLGFLVVAWAPDPVIAIGGLVVAGLGLANIFPYAIAQAGQRGGPDGVALASTLGYGGIMISGPLVGFVAQASTLRVGVSVIAVLVLLAGLITLALARRSSLVPAPAV